MDDERWYKHTSAFNSKSSSGKRRKIDNNRRKKEAEKEDRREGGTDMSVLFSASFFLLLLSIFPLLPEEDLLSKALACLYHPLSSLGEYSFLVLFLTCLPNQQLLAFSSYTCVNNVTITWRKDIYQKICYVKQGFKWHTVYTPDALEPKSTPFISFKFDLCGADLIYLIVRSAFIHQNFVLCISLKTWKYFSGPLRFGCN